MSPLIRWILYSVCLFAFLACLKLPDKPVEQMDWPELFVTNSNITDRQLDVARNTTIRLVFNQPLDPESLDDTEIIIESGNLKMHGRKKYDLLTRTLTFEPNSDLRANLWYKFVLKKHPLSIMGTRPDQEEINILFKTGSYLSEEEPPPETVNFEEEIFPLFGLANCFCHSSFNPMMGAQFIYETPREFLSSAVATESKEWKNWIIINPGRHEKSYMMYKLLGDDRLGLPTITGERMPPPPLQPLDFEAVEKIKDWIEQGAGSGT